MTLLSPAQQKAFSKIEAVVIGSSAGGIEALKAILPRVRPQFPASVIVVQHIGMKSSTTLVQFFQTVCVARVKEVEDKEALQPGTIYFAPAGYHVLLESDRSLALSVDAPVSYSRPSIDVLMESAADAFGYNVLAVILTGANQDGAAGFQAIMKAGGLGVVQDPKTAAFSAMPEAAVSAFAPTLILPLVQIGELFQELQTTLSQEKEV